MGARDNQTPDRSAEQSSTSRERQSSRATIRRGGTTPPESRSRPAQNEAEQQRFLEVNGRDESLTMAPVPDWLETVVPSPSPSRLLYTEPDSLLADSDPEHRSRGTAQTYSSAEDETLLGKAEPGPFIPPAPRLPQLDLEPTSRPSSALSSRPRPLGDEAPLQAENPLGALDSSPYPKTIRSPAPPPRTSHLPAMSATAQVDEYRDPTERYSSRPPAIDSNTLEGPHRRLYFAPHLRIQANQWRKTGALSLPASSSPRHSRALQRALLLSMLQDPGWEALPDGLRQRAGWLFSTGWESSAGRSHPFREMDDLATVLGISCNTETRHLLQAAIFDFLPPRSPSPH